MTKKFNWADMDKRIRGRRVNWTADELKAVEAALAKLPDQASQFEYIDTPQPALHTPTRDDSSN